MDLTKFKNYTNSNLTKFKDNGNLTKNKDNGNLTKNKDESGVNLTKNKDESGVNLTKIKDDFYFNFDNLNNQNYKIMQEFGLRPNMPIRKSNLIFIEVEQEDIKSFYFKDKNYSLYWDNFPINNQEFSHLNIQQNFINISVKIPAILHPEIYENNIVKIFNSKNLENCYRKIIQDAGHNLNNMILVYTKRFYLPDKYGGIKFNEETVNNKGYFYIIPHINIYNNYHMLDNKFICELTGTIMS